MTSVLRPISTLTLLSIFLSLPHPAATAQDRPGAGLPGASHYEIPESDDGLPGAGPLRRYEWFRKLWKERRTEWSKQVAADQGALVFLGDSITQGWGDDLDGAFPGVKVANRGISGDTTRGMLIRLPEDVLALHPRGVVMLMGTNDLEEHASPETIASNLRLIIDRIRSEAGPIPVIVCEVFPSSASMRRPANLIREVNRLYGKVARSDPDVTLLDTWTLFADDQGDAKPEEFPDLLHPNEKGYAKWAAALRPILATLGFLDTEPDRFQPETGFRSLFNGKDLSGWGFRPTSAQDIEAKTRWQASDPEAAEWPIVTAPADFSGKQSSEDGRFLALNGRLVVTTPSEGRRIQQLWTLQEFSRDFVLKLEFRATPNADSGVFIRGTQLQCRDYSLAGPYKNLKSYRPQGWNELEIRVTGTTATCSCNGEVLEPALVVPSSGPIGLEGDRGQMEYRRIRIREGR